MCCSDDEIAPDISMAFLNWTNSLPRDLTASLNQTDLDQASCESPLIITLCKIQSILLIIFGFGANLCSFVVLTRPRLRRRPTFSYLAFLSLSNSLLSLIYATFNILGAYFNLSLEHLPLFIFCRFLNRFATDFLTHFSLYTLTAVDLDRIRTVTSKTAGPHRYSRANGGRQRGCAQAFLQVCLVESFLATILFLINAHWLIAYGYVNYESNSLEPITMCTIPYLNETNNINSYAAAYNQYLTSILPFIELILFNILPFLISLVATIIILRHVSLKYNLLNQINKRLKKSRRRMELHLSVLLISLNCVFILLTTPHNIYSIYIGLLHRRLISKSESEGDMCAVSVIQKSLDLLQQCYFMSTFFLYILTNKRFREEFCDLIRHNFLCPCSDHEAEHSSTHLSSRHHHRHRHRHGTNEDHKENYLMPPSQSMMPVRLSLTDYLSRDDDDERVSTLRGRDTTEMRLSVNRASLF